ncbi:hypothetical protein GCM10023347_20860 [Streptomyces chumphonensis]
MAAPVTAKRSVTAASSAGVSIPRTYDPLAGALNGFITRTGNRNGARRVEPAPGEEETCDTPAAGPGTRQ